MKAAAALAFLAALAGACGGRAIKARDAGGDGARDGMPDAAPDRAPSPDASNDSAAPAPDVAVDRAGDAAVDRGAAPSDAFVERAPPSPDAGFVASLDWFCEQTAIVKCAQLTRCHIAYADDGDCQLAEKMKCLGPVGEWEALAAAQGRVAFDPAKVDRCLATLAAGCGGRTDACEEVIAGKLAGGQPCRLDRPRECASGLCDWRDGPCAAKCAFASTGGGPCGGLFGCDATQSWCNERTHLCESKRARGAPCNPSDGDTETMCGPADFCALDADGTLCRFSGTGPCTCVPRRPANAACALDHQCVAGLICDFDFCRGPSARGEPCGFTAGCAGGLACVATDGGLAAICGDGKPEGTACNFGAECQPGMYCPLQAKACTRNPRQGESCADPFSFCPYGTFCDDGHICRARPKLGESCAGATDKCWGWNVVCGALIGMDAVCVTKPPVTLVCNPTCAGTTYCANGVCQPKKAADAGCAADVECTSARCACTDQDCASRRCEAVCP
jgi:hypothetical protein